MEKQYAPLKIASSNPVATTSQDKKMSKNKSPVETPKIETKKEEVKTEENKVEAKIIPAKKEEKKIVKELAIVKGNDLAISKKHSMSICNMIRGKTPDKAIEMLEQVVIMKKAVPMNNREVPHKHGMMAGRYPINASKVFIDLLKQLKANASVNGIDYPIISLARADKASRPFRRGGVRAKRTHILLEVKDKTKLGL
jgi:ribosomal protein L22